MSAVPTSWDVATRCMNQYRTRRAAGRSVSDVVKESLLRNY